MFTPMRTGQTVTVLHRKNAASSERRPVQIHETEWARARYRYVKQPLGPAIKIVERVAPAKTYTANGRREVARRLRQMEARHVEG